MATLKSTRPIADKPKVVSPESRCGVRVSVLEEYGCVWSGCGKGVIFPFSALIYVCNHISQTSHIKNNESVCYANVATTTHSKV